MDVTLFDCKCFSLFSTKTVYSKAKIDLFITYTLILSFLAHKNMIKTPSKVGLYLSKITEIFSTAKTVKRPVLPRHVKLT